MNLIQTENRMPSEVFKALIASDPSIDNWELAHLFIDAFPSVDALVITYIWRWKAPGSDRGLSDERVDEVLIDQLSQAGYLKS
jgi:hypothetical protein